MYDRHSNDYSRVLKHQNDTISSQVYFWMILKEMLKNQEQYHQVDE